MLWGVSLPLPAAAVVVCAAAVVVCAALLVEAVVMLTPFECVGLSDGERGWGTVGEEV